MQLNPLLNTAPNTPRQIHIMGICGTGMAALAGMLQKSGFQVSGSDSKVYPPMSLFLEQLGIPILNGYRPENLDHSPDLVIVGNVISRDNPEAIALATSGIPYLSFPQALSLFFIDNKTSLVVAGTHGKTTTCSLLASALEHAKLDPSFMIGGIIKEFSTNFRLGSGNYFVSEGDEYDTAFFDKESKFLHYQPHNAIITSVEFDHADIFTDLDQIKNAFKKFVSLIPKTGLIIAHLDDDNVREVVADAHCEVQGYGCDPNNSWSVQEIVTEKGTTRCSVYHHGQLWSELSLPLSGTYNCLNSLAVAALLHHLGLSKEVIRNGLGNFGGVKRRQEIRGIERGVTVIDDFAHHPTAVKATLKGLHDAYRDQRLIAVFEPRTNSSRRAIFQKEYITSFDAADCVLLREPIPLENVNEEDHFSSQRLAKDLAERGLEARSFSTTTSILEYLAGILQPDDVVAILSNGGFDNIHTRLLEILKE